MADLAKLLVRIEADNSKLRSELTKTTRQVERFGKRTDRVARRVASSLKSMAAAYVSFQGLSAVSREISGLESTLSAVEAVTGATASQMEALTASARKLGATTVFSAREAAQGMEFLGRAGFNTQEIISAMPGLLSLASAGALELGRAADIASNVLSGFQLSAEESNRVADVLASSAASANTSVEQLGEAMTYVAPVAAGFGKSVEETAAAVGILGNAGIQASMAGTGLRQIFARLADVTPQAEIAIRSLGLSVAELNPETNSTLEIVGKLADAGISAGQALAIFGDRAGPAVLALTSQRGDLEELVQKLQGASGSAERMAKTMSDNLEGDVKSFGSAIAELTQKLGDSGLRGAMRGVVQEGTQFARYLSSIVEGGTLDELQNKISFYQNASPGEAGGPLRKSYWTEKLKEQIDERLAELSGPQGLRQKIQQIEDELARAEMRARDIQRQIDDTPYTRRSLTNMFGFDSQYKSLQDSLIEHIRTMSQLRGKRDALFEELANAEFDAPELDLAGVSAESTTAAAQLGDEIEKNNKALGETLTLLDAQADGFKKVVESAREAISSPAQNTLISGTLIQVNRDIEAAQRLAGEGQADKALRRATAAVELTKQLAEQGRLSKTYAETLLKRAEAAGGAAVEAGVRLAIDTTDVARQAADAAKAAAEQFTAASAANPARLSVEVTTPAPAASPSLEGGGAGGTPLTISVGGKEFTTRIPADDADQIRAPLERESLRRGGRC